MSFLKPLLFFLWMVVLGGAVYGFFRVGIPLVEYPGEIRLFLDGLGGWGPMVYILVYAIRPVIFFPATILTVVSGILFGPWYGILYTIVGENLSASLAFGIGRFFGHAFVKEADHAFVQKMNRKVEKNGFMTVLLMRLLYVPFDLTNYLSGVSTVRYRDYALATFIGILPGLVTFVLLGGAAGIALGIDPTVVLEGGMSPAMRGWLTFGFSVVLFVLSLWGSQWLRNRGLKALETES